jgi:hypothetical protein
MVMQVVDGSRGRGVRLFALSRRTDVSIAGMLFPLKMGVTLW